MLPRSSEGKSAPTCAPFPWMFQSLGDWQLSGLGLALQLFSPDVDGAIEPIIYAGREGATGRRCSTRRLHQSLGGPRHEKWANLVSKPKSERKSPCQSFPSCPTRVMSVLRPTWMRIPSRLCLRNSRTRDKTSVTLQS